MSGLWVNGLRYPALWGGHEDVDNEPIFIMVHEQGALGMLTLDYVRELAQDVYDGERTWEDAFAELYIKLPHSNRLKRASLGFAGEPGALKLTVVTDEPGVTWTADL